MAVFRSIIFWQDQKGKIVLLIFWKILIHKLSLNSQVFSSDHMSWLYFMCFWLNIHMICQSLELFTVNIARWSNDNSWMDEGTNSIGKIIQLLDWQVIKNWSNFSYTIGRKLKTVIYFLFRLMESMINVCIWLQLVINFAIWISIKIFLTRPLVVNLSIMHERYSKKLINEL